MNKSKNSSHQPPYDLWADLGESAAGGKLAAVTKNRRPTKQHYVPSLLPAVVVPDEGASYNPPVSSYLKFVNKVVKDEKKVEASERRMDRKMEPSEFELCSIKGLQRDDLFAMEDESKKKPPIDEVDEEMKPENERNEGKKKRKTARERRKQKRALTKQKLALGSGQQKKEQKEQLNSLKSLGRAVRAEMETQEAKLAKRRMRKTLRKLTKRKRLGRGKFEAHSDPVLGPSELPSSLRQMPTMLSASGILAERLKSFQRRNIVPVPGERNLKKLKSRLKAKFVQKRSVKEVTSTSLVI